MAYDHGLKEVLLLGTGAVGPTLTKFSLATGATLKAVWAPGYSPVIVRAVSILGLTTAAAVTKPVIKYKTVNGGVTATTGTTFSTVTLVSTVLNAKAFYDDQLNTKVSPGQQVNVLLTTKATAGTHSARAVLYVEPVWERPTNNTSMNDKGS